MGKVMVRTKRKGGQLSGKAWLVLTESKKAGAGWKHSCGGWVRQVDVTCSHRDGVSPLSGDGSTKTTTVPFCPDCELKPVSGEYSDQVAPHVTTWES